MQWERSLQIYTRTHFECLPHLVGSTTLTELSAADEIQFLLIHRPSFPTERPGAKRTSNQIEFVQGGVVRKKGWSSPADSRNETIASLMSIPSELPPFDAIAA